MWIIITINTVLEASRHRIGKWHLQQIRHRSAEKAILNNAISHYAVWQKKSNKTLEAQAEVIDKGNLKQNIAHKLDQLGYF